MNYQPNVSINFLSVEETELMVKIYHLRNSLFCFCGIDLIFNILNGFLMINTSYYWSNFILGLIILFGFIGIKNYNPFHSQSIFF